MSSGWWLVSGWLGINVLVGIWVWYHMCCKQLPPDRNYVE